MAAVRPVALLRPERVHRHREDGRKHGLVGAPPWPTVDNSWDCTSRRAIGRYETYPMVFQPFGGFGDETVIENGLVRPPEAPGIGVETKSKLYNTVLKPLIDG